MPSISIVRNKTHKRPFTFLPSPEVGIILLLSLCIQRGAWGIPFLFRLLFWQERMIPACHGRRIITTDRVRHRMSSVDRIFTDRSAGNQGVTCSQVPVSGPQRQGVRSRRLNVQAKSHTGTLSAIFLRRVGINYDPRSSRNLPPAS